MGQNRIKGGWGVQKPHKMWDIIYARSPMLWVGNAAMVESRMHIGKSKFSNCKNDQQREKTWHLNT